MAASRRHIPYESAFEDYLRSAGVAYVPVDEARRAVLAGERIKSFDFLVYPQIGPHWIVDVKGRQFPYISETGARRYWENWVTREDLDSLSEWQTVFGPEFQARFVFAYVLDGPPDRWPPVEPYRYAGDDYAFLTVTVEDYRQHCRARSASWETVAINTETFRQIVTPVNVASPAVDAP